MRVLVVSARAPQLFGELAARLAARHVAAETTEFTAFSQSIVGRQFTALANLIERMKAADEGAASKTEWWPAPDLQPAFGCRRRQRAHVRQEYASLAQQDYRGRQELAAERAGPDQGRA